MEQDMQKYKGGQNILGNIVDITDVSIFYRDDPYCEYRLHVDFLYNGKPHDEECTITQYEYNAIEGRRGEHIIERTLKFYFILQGK